MHNKMTYQNPKKHTLAGTCPLARAPGLQAAAPTCSSEQAVAPSTGMLSRARRRCRSTPALMASCSVLGQGQGGGSVYGGQGLGQGRGRGSV